MATILEDQFFAPDGTSLYDHHLLVGGDWTQFSSEPDPPEIWDLHLRHLGFTAAAAVDATIPDVVMSGYVKVSVISAQLAAGLVARLVDEANYWLLIAGDGNLSLYLVVVGFYELKAQAVAVVAEPDRWYKLEWRLEGTSHVILLDDDVVITIDNGVFLEETWFGLQVSTDQENPVYMDSFLVTGNLVSEVQMPNIKSVLGRPIVTTDGQSVVAKTLLDGSIDWAEGNSPPVVHLYSEDVPLTTETVLDDLTECAGSGYAEVSLDSLVGALDEDGVPILQNEFAASFELDALDTLYSASGYYITDAASDSLIACERFDEGFPLDGIGDKIVIIPRILLPGFTPPADLP